MHDVDHILAIFVENSGYLGSSVLNFLDHSSVFLLIVVGFLLTYVGQYFCPQDRRFALAQKIAIAFLIPYFIYRYISVGSNDFFNLVATVVRTVLAAWVVYGTMLLVVPCLWVICDWIVRTLRRMRRSCSRSYSSFTARRENRRRIAEERRLEAIEAAKVDPPPPPPPRSELLPQAMADAHHRFDAELHSLHAGVPEREPEVLAKLITYSDFLARYKTALLQTDALLYTNVVRTLHIETVLASLVRYPKAMLALLRNDQAECLHAWNHAPDRRQQQKVTRSILLSHKQMAHRLPRWLDASTMRLIVDCIVLPETLSFSGVPHEPPMDALSKELLEKIALRQDTQKAYDKAAAAIRSHYSREEFSVDLANCRLSEPLESYKQQCETLQGYITKFASTTSHGNDQAMQHAQAEYKAVIDRLESCSDAEREEIWNDIYRKYFPVAETTPPLPHPASGTSPRKAVS